MVVTAVPVPEVGTAPSAPPPRRTDDRVDNFTDLAARLQLDASVVRRALVSREELLPVFGEMSFADCYVSTGLEIGLVFAADKFSFGLRLRELGFIEDFSRMVVTIPADKRAAVIAWLRELMQAKTVGREEFRSLVHTLVSF